MTTASAELLACLIVRDVAELPDRTSPEDQPDMMLVTADELRSIVCAALTRVPPAADAYVLMPRVPTEKMLSALRDNIGRFKVGPEGRMEAVPLDGVYAALLGAAPTAEE
jgi:hypothetical protein